MTEHIILDTKTESVKLSKDMSSNLQKALIYGSAICESPNIYEWQFTINDKELAGYIFIGICPSDTDFSKNIRHFSGTINDMSSIVLHNGSGIYNRGRFVNNCIIRSDQVSSVRMILDFTTTSLTFVINEGQELTETLIEKDVSADEKYSAILELWNSYRGTTATITMQ